MIADLHIHTQFSDGSLTPRDAVRLAKQAGIGLLAVCDHNTVDAFAQTARACAEFEVRCISGVEIDCTCAPYELHILGLGIQPVHATLSALLKQCRATLDSMSDDLIAAMEAAGLPVSTKEFAAFVREPSHGGWKGIDYLETKGLSAVFPECMRLYGAYGIRPRAPWPALSEVCAAIHASGGKAIVAHPGNRLPHHLQELRSALELLRQNGVDGVECFYPSHTPEITQVCQDFCRAHGLCITCGSDSHGTFAREIDEIIYEFGAACQEESELCLQNIRESKIVGDEAR